MEDPKAYAETNWVNRKDIQEFLESSLPHFEWDKEERILDIGSGPGNNTSEMILPFLPEDAVLVGCDISKPMVDYANNYYRNDRLWFKTLDIEENGIEESWKVESFDKIVSFFCMHWIQDLRKALENIHSLLKPNGYILLASLTPENFVYSVLENVRKLPKWEIFIKECKWFQLKDPKVHYERLLRDTGFVSISCVLKKVKRTYTSLTSYLGLIKSIDPYIKYIPDKMKPDYIQDLEKSFMEDQFIEFDEVNKRFLIENNHIICVARKLPVDHFER